MEVIEILRSLVLNSNMSVNEKEDNLARLAKLDEMRAESENDFVSTNEAENYNEKEEARS